jgi:CRP-like cAMP-binding protein
LFTGSGEPETIRAMTFAVVYEVAQSALAQLMHDRPGIADEIAVTLSQRAKSGTSSAATVADAPTVSARIRQLFCEVPHHLSRR